MEGLSHWPRSLSQEAAELVFKFTSLGLKLCLTQARPTRERGNGEKEKERKGGADHRESQRKEAGRSEGENHYNEKKKEM